MAKELSHNSAQFHVDLNLIPLKMQVNAIWLLDAYHGHGEIEETLGINKVNLSHIYLHKEQILKRWTDATKLRPWAENNASREEKLVFETIDRILFEETKHIIGNKTPIDPCVLERYAQHLRKGLCVPNYHIPIRFWNALHEFASNPGNKRRRSNYPDNLTTINILKDVCITIQTSSLEKFMDLAKTQQQEQINCVAENEMNVDEEEDNDVILLEQPIECIDVSQGEEEEEIGKLTDDNISLSKPTTDAIVTIKTEHQNEEHDEEDLKIRPEVIEIMKQIEEDIEEGECFNEENSEQVNKSSDKEPYNKGQTFRNQADTLYAVKHENITNKNITDLHDMEAQGKGICHDLIDNSNELEIKSHTEIKTDPSYATNTKLEKISLKTFQNHEGVIQEKITVISKDKRITHKKCDNLPRCNKLEMESRLENETQASQINSMEKTSLTKHIANRMGNLLKNPKRKRNAHEAESTGKEIKRKRKPKSKRILCDKPIGPEYKSPAKCKKRQTNVKHKKPDLNRINTPSVKTLNETAPNEPSHTLDYKCKDVESEHKLLNRLLLEWSKRYILNGNQPPLKPSQILAQADILKDLLNLPNFEVNLELWNDLRQFRDELEQISDEIKQKQYSLQYVDILLDCKSAKQSESFGKFINNLTNQSYGILENGSAALSCGKPATNDDCEVNVNVLKNDVPLYLPAAEEIDPPNPKTQPQSDFPKQSEEKTTPIATKDAQDNVALYKNRQQNSPITEIHNGIMGFSKDSETELLEDMHDIGARPLKIKPNVNNTEKLQKSRKSLSMALKEIGISLLKEQMLKNSPRTNINKFVDNAVIVINSEDEDKNADCNGVRNIHNDFDESHVQYQEIAENLKYAEAVSYGGPEFDNFNKSDSNDEYVQVLNIIFEDEEEDGNVDMTTSEDNDERSNVTKYYQKNEKRIYDNKTVASSLSKTAIDSNVNLTKKSYTNKNRNNLPGLTEYVNSMSIGHDKKHARTQNCDDQNAVYSLSIPSETMNDIGDTLTDVQDYYSNRHNPYSPNKDDDNNNESKFYQQIVIANKIYTVPVITANGNVNIAPAQTVTRSQVSLQSNSDEEAQVCAGRQDVPKELALSNDLPKISPNLQHITSTAAVTKSLVLNSFTKNNQVLKKYSNKKLKATPDCHHTEKVINKHHHPSASSSSSSCVQKDTFDFNQHLLPIKNYMMRHQDNAALQLVFSLEKALTQPDV